MAQKPASFGKIQTRSFLTAFVLLAVFMLLAYALCFILPGGEYTRAMIDGKETILPDSYTSVEHGLPLWQWLLSPVLVLGYESGSMLILIIVFLLLVAGSFAAIEKAGVLSHMLSVLAAKFRHRRWLLLSLVTFIMMAMGAFVGSFEECIPMIPIAVSLSLAMGWDALVGLGMSLLATGFGFASGVMNPFTVGVAQSLAGLPMFSGLSMRLLAFVLMYALVLAFLMLYARRLERRGNAVQAAADTAVETEKNPRMDRALAAFAVVIVIGLVCAIVFGAVPGLSDLVMPAMALMFLLSSVASVRLSGAGWGQYGRWFAGGLLGLAPATVLLLMASAIRYILVEGHVMDTILHGAVALIEGRPQAVAILLVYALVLVLNAVISSGSAKAFLLIPLIMPLIDLVGIPRQLAIVAFAFGDGFSNVFYPTNVALLIGLSIADVGYGRWFRFTWVLQLVTLLVTAGLLMLGLSTGYR